MSQSNIKSWSTTAASNNDGSTGGMPEGQAPNTVNDYVRTQMAAHRIQWEDAEWFNWGHTVAYSSGTEFTATIAGTNSDSGTNVYSLGRRVKIYDATGGTSEIRYGTIISISAAAANQYKVNCVIDAGAITSSISSVAVGILNSVNPSTPSFVMPAGVTVPYAGTTAPTSWLLCYGQSVSISVYPALYAAIGTTYGGAGGVFTIPDLRGRAVFGKDDMGGAAASRITAAGSSITATALGAVGGSEFVQAHTHTYTASSYTAANPGGGASALTAVASNTGSYGSGDSENMPPAIILNYIIKT